MYKPITSFLLLKPTLDLTNVAEFYKLFNSSALDYKIERKWITDVLIYGCRTSFDYRLCEKRFVFKQLLSIYDSRLSDAELKAGILKLIERTCKNKYSLIELVKKHSLLIWLTDIIEKDRHSQSPSLGLFCQKVKIFLQVWRTLKPKLNEQDEKETQENEDEDDEPKESSKTSNSTQTWTFLNQMFILSKIMLQILSKNSKKVVQLDADEAKAARSDKMEVDEPDTSGHVRGRRLVIKKFLTSLHEIVEDLKQLSQKNLDSLTKTPSVNNILFNFRDADFKCLSLINQDHDHLYKNELFLILIGNGFTSNLSPETSVANWTFLMNYIGSGDLFKSLLSPENQDYVLNRLWTTVESCLTNIDLTTDSTDQLTIYIKQARLMSVTNLCEFFENLNSFAALSAGNLSEVQQKFSALIKTFLAKLAQLDHSSPEERELVASLNYAHSKKRSRSTYDLAKEFESSLKKLKTF